MIIMKFGGTSLQDAAALCGAARIVEGNLEDRPLVVVSAVAGVTRQLLDLSARAASAGPAAVDAEIVRLRELHQEIAADLQLEAVEQTTYDAALDETIESLAAVLANIGRAGDADAAAQDATIAHGELLSAALFAAAARSIGLPVERVPAAEVVITDDSFRSARPDRAAIDVRARVALDPLIESSRVPIVEGFIGATAAGVPTTMGFEASDLTAALLGSALDATQIQIWTDVPGMLTVVHPAVADPRRVPLLSFTEAGDLARFGAKVLHPDTVGPARRKGIPVRILHAACPHGAGTWITAPAAAPGSPKVKAIAVQEDIASAGVADVVQTLSLGVDLADSVMLCPVGVGIGSHEATLSRVRNALRGLDSSALPVADDRLPLVVPRAQAAEAVRRLHDALVCCADGPPDIKSTEITKLS